MNFRIKWHGRYVGTVVHIVGLEHKRPLTTNRECSEQRGAWVHLGRGRPGSIILQRAVICDAEFRTRLASYQNSSGDQTTGVDLVVEAVRERGIIAQAYKVNGCRLCTNVKLPVLNEHANAAPIEALVIEHEGWESGVTAPEAESPNLRPAGAVCGRG